MEIHGLFLLFSLCCCWLLKIRVVSCMNGKAREAVRAGGPHPQFAECREVWLTADEDRWQAHLDTGDELVFYCPECAEREFGERP
jgi:hypothetical protein